MAKVYGCAQRSGIRLLNAPKCAPTGKSVGPGAIAHARWLFLLSSDCSGCVHQHPVATIEETLVISWVHLRGHLAWSHQRPGQGAKTSHGVLDSVDMSEKSLSWWFWKYRHFFLGGGKLWYTVIKFTVVNHGESISICHYISHDDRFFPETFTVWRWFLYARPSHDMSAMMAPTLGNYSRGACHIRNNWFGINSFRIFF